MPPYKPGYTIKVPPSTTGNGKPSDVPAPLWTAILAAAKKSGVTPQVLAGIWRTESGSTYPNAAVNSSGYGGLFGTTNWNASTQAQADLAAQVLRDNIRQTGNLHDALLAYSGGAYATVPGVTVPRTRAQAVSDAAAAAAAKQASPGYVQATTNLSVTKSEALAAAKATAHVTDPWVTVVKDKAGNVTGFGEATGESAPPNVLTIGGAPATKSDYQLAWSNTYATDYTAFTGQTATAAVQAQILESGVSNYTMMQQLANQPGFTSSPIYKNQGAGIADQVKQTLGKPAPASFVKEAIVNSWDSTQIAANLKKLPGYQQGPVFQQAYDQAKTTYSDIYGTAPNPGHDDWLKNAVVNGWSQDEIAQRLRADPAYTASPEFASKAYTLLSSLGLPTTAPAPLPPLPKPTPTSAAPPVMQGAAAGTTIGEPPAPTPASQAARAA